MRVPLLVLLNLIHGTINDTEKSTGGETSTVQAIGTQTKQEPILGTGFPTMKKKDL